MESLTPNLFVKDISATVAFYEKLGFSVTMNVPDQAPFIWANMKCGDVNLMFQSWESLGNELPEIDRKESSGPVLYYINVKNIRTFFEKLKGKVSVVKGLEKTFYGATEFTIKDPNGIILTFAEHEA